MIKGVYVLIIEIPSDRVIDVGSLGKLLFKKGFYVYVGSALSGLEGRVRRHLLNTKRVKWHIDYLTVLFKPKFIIYAKTQGRFECLVAAKLREMFAGINGFGSSDCKCKTHLYYSKDLDLLVSSTLRVFKELGLKPFLRVAY